MKSIKDEIFDPKKFVKDLHEEGFSVRCDNSQEFFRKMELPHFYDEEKFKRGQKFFHDHIFAMFYGKLLGLISDLAFPEGVAILKHTNKSSEPESAFKRYVSTIFHMYTWYSSELQPGSKLWKSLIKVRTYHNAASNMCRRNGIGQITQYQMAIGQFGFMGYIISRPKLIGLHRADDEDLKGFVHFWRVVGCLLGIEERFNICRDSVSETQAVCDEIITQILRPQILKWDPSFLNMVAALTGGLWCMMPVLNRNVCLRQVYQMVRSEENDESPIELSYFERFVYYFVKSVTYILIFDTMRTILNCTVYFMLYCTEKFPFLAYWKFRKIDFGISRCPRQRISNYLS